MKVHMQEALDSNKTKIISFLKIIYFLFLNNVPLSSFLDFINFGRYMKMPSISTMDDYRTYGNFSI